MKPGDIIQSLTAPFRILGVIAIVMLAGAGGSVIGDDAPPRLLPKDAPAEQCVRAGTGGAAPEWYVCPRGPSKAEKAEQHYDRLYAKAQRAGE